MKALWLAAGLMLLGWTSLAAESVVVYKDSAQLRAKPQARARVVGLVFGGESLEVQQTRAGWFQVRNSRDEQGWLSDADADLARRVAARPGEPRAVLLATGNRHQYLARIPEARMAYTEIMLRFPGTYEAYAATRRMLKYHRLATLPEPQRGHITAGQERQGRSIAARVLVAEARALMDEGRLKLAGQVLGALEVAAGEDLREVAELERIMIRYVGEVSEQLSADQLVEAVALFRRMLPDAMLPPEIERRVPREPMEAPARAPASVPPGSDEGNGAGDSGPSAPAGESTAQDGGATRSPSSTGE